MGVDHRLEVKGLSKTFARVQVLRDVELTVSPGEVHGLAGQNGSGKSTLIKILTGLYTPDPRGQYRVDGVEIRLPVRWREVHAAGVSVVHQDLGLLDHLSIAENICVGGFPTKLAWTVDRAERDVLSAHTLERLGVALDPQRLVGSLSPAERAEVAIARAMRDHPERGGMVILDEATRALAGDDLHRIHALLRRVADGGGSILLVSHNLTELIDVADRLTVLRDGAVVKHGVPARQLAKQEVAYWMLGSDVPSSRRPVRATTPRVPFAEVIGLTGSRVTDTGFEIGAGEVVGITGLPGGGYEDIPYLITGAQRATSGSLRLGKRVIDLSSATVATVMGAGAVLVPERRERDGLAFEQSAVDNYGLPALGRRGKPWFVSRGWQRDGIQQAVKTLGIRPTNTSLLVKQLSGGNQQKVLLAKWLGLQPALLVLHEPTQAVDVGARHDILNAIRRTALSGASVLIVTSEPEDLAAICDRVLIYRHGAGLSEASELSPNALIDQVYEAAGSGVR